MNYFGQNFDHEALDWLSVQHVNRKLFKGESPLYNSKWWDYRELHPLSATYLFAHHYILATKKAISTRRDLFMGVNAKILKCPDLLDNEPGTISGMWKARQAADRLGIKYSNYCTSAMNYAIMCDWTFLPAPRQLYSSTVPENGSNSLIGYIETKWDDYLGYNQPDPDSDFFLIKNYTGHKYQNQHILHLLDRVSRSKAKPHIIHHYLFNTPMLTKGLILKKFGACAEGWLNHAIEINNEENQLESNG